MWCHRDDTESFLNVVRSNEVKHLFRTHHPTPADRTIIPPNAVSKDTRHARGAFVACVGTAGDGIEGAHKQRVVEYSCIRPHSDVDWVAPSR